MKKHSKKYANRAFVKTIKKQQYAAKEMRLNDALAWAIKEFEKPIRIEPGR